jgi:uncharacterized repeat protein (TIGR02543 family)
MKWSIWLLLSLSAAAAVSFSSCLLGGQDSLEEGILQVSFSDGARSIWTADSADSSIESCRLVIQGPGETAGSISRVFNTGAAEGVNITVDGLRAGEYRMEIEGFDALDAGGGQIAFLKEQESGERTVPFTIRRGEVTQVTAELVPTVGAEYTGTLEISSISFLGFSGDTRLMQNNPEITLSLSSLGSADLSGFSATAPTYTENDGKRDLSSPAPVTAASMGTYSVTYGESSTGDAGPEDIGKLTLADIPGGWYELTVDFRLDIENEGGDARENRYRQDVYFVQILNGKTTSGSVTVRGSQLETGTLDAWIFENMEPMEVTLSEGANINGGIVAAENYSVEFSASGTKFAVTGIGSDAYVTTEPLSKDARWYWYVNGQLAYEESGSESTFVSNGAYQNQANYYDPDYDGAYPGNFLGEAGVYELVVYVLDFGNSGEDAADNNYFGSASATVTVDKEVTVTVSYDANGGEGSISSYDVTVNGDYSQTLSDGTGFTRTNYTFTGWNTSSDGSGVTVTADTPVYIGDDHTLYAQWQMVN